MGTCRSGSIMLAFKVKTIKACLLLAAMHKYASHDCINLPNLYKSVVCNTHTKTNVSSSRKESAKMERDVCLLTSNYLIAGLIRTSKDPQPA